MVKAIRRYLKGLKGETSVVSVDGFDFIVKPLTPETIIDVKVVKSRIDELQKAGKTNDQISEIIAPEVISRVLKMSDRDQVLYFLKRYVVYPIITENKKQYHKDELPLSVMSRRAINKLTSKMIKTSDLFNKALARA